MVNASRLEMIFTDKLVLNEMENETIVDKNEWFLNYKPPKMETILCEIQ